LILARRRIVNAIVRHLGRCLVAGVVALLPVAGIVLAVVYAESTIASSWLAKQSFYFPGLGLLAVVVALYLIGLVVGTMVGRWAWSLVDRFFDRLPILGNLYQTLKQLLGYGEGPGALFERVVLVPTFGKETLELGLVTNTIRTPGQADQVLVFVPACPNPMQGRLVLIEADRVRPVNMHVNQAMRTLVAMGKAGVQFLQVSDGDRKALALPGQESTGAAEAAKTKS
jgi:uncharacterized membrane protein